MSPRAPLLIALLALGLGSCISVPEGDQGSPMLEGRLLTQRELRIRLYDFVVRFSSAVETAADEIAARADSHAVRSNALQWKVNAVPACESAAFDSDPVVGLVDVWTLVARMSEYFGSEVGTEAFRDLAEVGREVLEGLEAEVEAIATELDGVEGMQALRAQVRAFAAEHPFEGLAFQRPIDLPVFDVNQRSSSEGLLEVAASADERLDDTADRLTIYTASLPKQARWQAELLVEQTLGRPEFTDLTALARSVPTLVAQERATVLEALSAEREALTAAADAQRIETLEFARAEREATLEAIDTQRRESITALDEQRVDTLEAFDAQRRETVAALDEQRLETLEALSAERAALALEVDRQREATLAHLSGEREAILEWIGLERNAAIDYASEATAKTSGQVLGRAFIYALVLVLAPMLLFALVVLIARPRVSIDLSRRSAE